MIADLAIATPPLDVQSTLLLDRCRCGGSPKGYKGDIGCWYVCASKCNAHGSGVYRTPEEAGRAWNTWQRANR